MDRISNNPLWFVYYTRLKVFGSEDFKEIACSTLNQKEKRWMVLWRNDRSEITGDILGRHVPRPAKRGMGRGTYQIPGGKGHNICLFLFGSPAGGFH